MIEGRMWPPTTNRNPPEAKRDSVTSTNLSLTSSILSNLSSRWIETNLIKTEDQVIQTIRLEENYPNRERFLCLLSREGVVGSPGEPKKNISQDLTATAAVGDKESDLSGGFSRYYFILGIDRYPSQSPENRDDAVEKTSTIGLVLPMLWDMQTSLDGDGGFSLRQVGKHFIFKPITVQSLWTIIQTLHVVCQRLKPLTNQDMSWLDRAYAITSPQSCINDWHYMCDILVRRPASPERIFSDQKSIEHVIKNHLRAIMKKSDLDSITSKSIRNQLEAEMEQSLEKMKSFIDQEILLILGQMDPASKILAYTYLGSEWNASNLDELRLNGITHILNVTREIDNFYPGIFIYKNIREYDEEKTDLLKYLDKTYKFIKNAKENGGKVLIHCKMGISRSATVTISYIMKEYGKGLAETLQLVRKERPIVNPNKSFIKQLEVYEGILGASQHRNTYFGLKRSKSESSLAINQDEEPKKKLEPFNINIKALSVKFGGNIVDHATSEPICISRPKSWSPDEKLSDVLMPETDSGVKSSCNCFGSYSLDNPDYCSQLDRNHLSSYSLNENCQGFVEARNLNLVAPPVNSSNLGYDPDCHCDMEVLIPVPKEGLDDQNTDDSNIVQSLSMIPIKVRNSESLFTTQYQKPSPQSLPLNELTSNKCDISTKLRDEGEETLMQVKEKKSEELSVKTLAHMFDFKEKSSPIRPFTTLEDNKVFQKARQQAEHHTSSEC